MKKVDARTPSRDLLSPSLGLSVLRAHRLLALTCRVREPYKQRLIGRIDAGVTDVRDWPRLMGPIELVDQLKNSSSNVLAIVSGRGVGNHGSMSVSRSP